MPTARMILGDLCGEEVQVDDQIRTLTAAATGGPHVLKRVLDLFEEAQVHVSDVGLRRPTLDDVFLSLTGHAAVEPSPESEDEPAGRRGRRESREKEKEAVR
jgi:ABC-2 type transport system ATP-binding protein